MTIRRIDITSDEQWHALRAKNVGASEIGALFGCHDYITAYSLSARKLGLLERESDTEMMRRGRLLEPVAIQCLREERPTWQIIQPHAYYCDEDAHLGCTPDCLVETEDGQRGVVQIKSVEPNVFARKWHNENGDVEPPIWIAMQAMLEAHLTGADFAYVAALVVGHGVHFELIKVPLLPDVIRRITERTQVFWEIVDSGKPVDPDFGRDLATIAVLHRQDDGTELDLTGDNAFADLAARLDMANHAKTMANKTADELKAKILHRIGAAQRVKFSGGSLSAKTVETKEHLVRAFKSRRLTLKLDRAQEEDAA